MSHAILGILMLVLATFELSAGRREDYTYIELTLGLLALFVSWFIWWRSKRDL